MERKEPSLVPEWLKGVASAGATTGGVFQLPQSSFRRDGNSGSSHSLQRVASNASVGNSSSDYEWLPHALSDGVNSPSSRRPISSRGVYASSAELVSHSRSVVISSHSGFDHESGLASNMPFVSGHGSFCHENGLSSDSQSDRDWNYEKLRMHREKGKDGAFNFDDHNTKERDRYHSEPYRFQRQGSEKNFRYKADAANKRGQSGVRVPKNESSTFLKSGFGVATNIQKAAFEHNFPSLTAQERRLATAQPHVGKSVLNSNISNVPLSGADRKSIAPSEFQVAFLEKAPQRVKEVSIGGMNEETIKLCAFPEHSALSGGLAAPASQPTLFPTITKELVSSSNSTLKPATALSPADKFTVKSVQLADPDILTSQVFHSSSLASNARPEVSKSTDEKLVPQKTSREFSLSSASSSKLDGGTFPLGTSTSTGIPAAKKFVSQSHINGVNSIVGNFKKPRQLLDMRAVPISTALLTVSETGTFQQPKSLRSTGNEKRISAQAKKRTEFFDALRRKAAGDGDSLNTISSKSSDDRDTIKDVPVKNEFKDDDGLKTDTDMGNISTVNVCNIQKSFSDLSISHDPCRTNGDFPVKGLIEGLPTVSKEFDASEYLLGKLQVSCDAVPEDEETAFLRSLGWQESTKEGEEALTEEEINAFYEEHMDSPLLACQKQRLKPLYGKSVVGSFGSISSGLSSSDSDSEDETNVQSR